MGRGWIRIWAVAAVAAGAAPAGAEGQPSVRSDDGVFEYTMAVDQLVYGLADSVFVTYAVHNMTDSTQMMNVCCCGVEFFAVRDSSCEFGEEGCAIAGCDACPVCFEGDGCSFDPCSPIAIRPDSTRVFLWSWDRHVCPEDFGFDPLWGNVGTFRLVSGYHVCGGGYQNRLELAVTVLKQVATFPHSWGSIKSRYGAGTADRVRPPG